MKKNKEDEPRLNYEDYYIDMEGFWRQLYNPEESRGSNYHNEKDGEKKYWHKNSKCKFIIKQYDSRI